MPRGVYERTPEYRAKMGLALKGRTMSPETRRKIAEARTTHGGTSLRAYRTWEAMKRRCLNPNDPAYEDYGARGITVCDRWLDFANFFADMGERPEGLTLDRIDNDGPYAPENCRWATRTEQARNTRSCEFITFGGVTKPLPQWAEDCGMKACTLRARLRSGWDVERALTTPVRPLRKVA